jgi:RES domain-containing protein
MKAYRIVKRRHAAQAFTGEGARLYGGRWNLAGTPMVYAAHTRALAALESLAHFGGAERRLRFVTFEIEIPDPHVAQLDRSTLPRGWRSGEPSPGTQEIGSRWQREGRSVALAVPSVIVPEEFCVLLNPHHPGTAHVMISYPVEFQFDERL